MNTSRIVAGLLCPLAIVISAGPVFAQSSTSGPFTVNNSLAYGFQQTGSTLIINQNGTQNAGCVDSSWDINFGSRGLYPSADQVALCENVFAGTPVATVTQPNFSYNNSTLTGYTKWNFNYNNNNAATCPPSNTASSAFGPNVYLPNSAGQPTCTSPLPALDTHLTFSPSLSASVVAQLRVNMIIGTSNNARASIIGWAADGSSIDVDSWVLAGNPILIGYDITQYPKPNGDNGKTITIGLNDSIEGQNVVLTVPTGVTDPGTGLAPTGVGYELDFSNNGQATTINPFAPSQGSPKYLGTLISCNGTYNCNAGAVYTGTWLVGIDVTNGAGATGSFVNDSSASHLGIGFWDQLGGNARTYGFQETNVSGTADVNFGITRMGETQSGIGTHKTFELTTKTYTYSTAAQPFSLDGNTTFSSANQPIYTNYWPVSDSASAAFLTGSVACTDGSGDAAFYNINVGFTVSTSGTITQTSAGSIAAYATIGTTTGWLLSVGNNGAQVYPIFSGATHIGCTAQLRPNITVAS